MLLMILRVAYLLICAGAILAYITSDNDQSSPSLIPGTGSKIVPEC
jgi:hypothetical protein